MQDHQEKPIDIKGNGVRKITSCPKRAQLQRGHTESQRALHRECGLQRPRNVRGDPFFCPLRFDARDGHQFNSGDDGSHAFPTNGDLLSASHLPSL